MTRDSLSLNQVLNTVPMAQKFKNVEGKLWDTFRALAGTEGKIYMFSTLKALGLATNDVRNFVSKQTMHKKVEMNVDVKLKKSAMQSKLRDACAYAKRLRQDKNYLRTKVLKKYQNCKSIGKKVVNDMVYRYRKLKRTELGKADRKIRFYREKNELEKSVKVAPQHTSEILAGVSLFSQDQRSIQPEAPLPPFICDESIKLSPNELKILSRGPKYMVREELSSDEFNLEVEKMVVKQNINEAFKEEDDLSNSPAMVETAALYSQTNGEDQTIPAIQKTAELGEHNIHYKFEEMAGQLVYNDIDKTLNLGNLRATNYKYNKESFLPNAGNVDIEKAHETRRHELRRVFNRVAGIKSHDKSNKSSNCQTQPDSNLSPAELAGLKSLKNRIKEGSIVVCDTDKSKRFCVLTKEQYLSSGSIHTSKDIEISPGQIKKIQTSVNEHVWWLKNISNCGTNWGHEDRMAKNVQDKGEQACSMVLLIKDHKNWSQGSNPPPVALWYQEIWA